MKKFEFQNLPKEGKISFVISSGRSIILDENTTDEQCEQLLANNDPNVAYYIKSKKESKEVAVK